MHVMVGRKGVKNYISKLDIALNLKQWTPFLQSDRPLGVGKSCKDDMYEGRGDIDRHDQIRSCIALQKHQMT